MAPAQYGEDPGCSDGPSQSKWDISESSGGGPLGRTKFRVWSSQLERHATSSLGPLWSSHNTNNYSQHTIRLWVKNFQPSNQSVFWSIIDPPNNKMSTFDTFLIFEITNGVRQCLFKFVGRSGRRVLYPSLWPSCDQLLCTSYFVTTSGWVCLLESPVRLLNMKGHCGTL